LAAPLIAYGILKTHLFDIDLKIQWAFRQAVMPNATDTPAYAACKKLQVYEAAISGARRTRVMDTLGRKPKTIGCDNVLWPGTN
jgi:hypothetical protein